MERHGPPEGHVMGALLVGWWIAIWPNLAANVIWLTPAWLLHHRRVDRKGRQERVHADRRHQELLAHISALIGSED